MHIVVKAHVPEEALHQTLRGSALPMARDSGWKEMTCYVFRSKNRRSSRKLESLLID